MKKLTLSLILSLFTIVVNAQLDPVEIDLLNQNVANLNYTSQNFMSLAMYYKYLEDNIGNLYKSNNMCQRKQENPSTFSICCCSKREEAYISLNLDNPMFTGLYTIGSTVGPTYNTATEMQYRTFSYDILLAMLNKLTSIDPSILNITKIEMPEILEPRAPDQPNYISNFKIWYSKCVEYKNCEIIGL